MELSQLIGLIKLEQIAGCLVTFLGVGSRSDLGEKAAMSRLPY
jgi:hypothetical protein